MRDDPGTDMMLSILRGVTSKYMLILRPIRSFHKHKAILSLGVGKITIHILLSVANAKKRTEAKSSDYKMMTQTL